MHHVIMENSRPRIMGQSKCLHTMNCGWNLLGYSIVQVTVPRRLRLLPSAPLTLCICVCVNVGLGSSLSKHVFDIQEMVTPISNRDAVLLLLTVTRKFAAHFVLLNLTSMIWFPFIVILNLKRNQVCYQSCLSHGVLY